MPRINSRRKGAKNERNVAKLFEKWTGKEFSRTPSSGGLNWKSSNSKGDIVCTTEGHFFPFCVEVKAHKDINFSHLLNPKIKEPKILEFWKQCERDAIKANKLPLLIMRYDGMPADFHFFMMRENISKQLFYPTVNPFPYYLKVKIKDDSFFIGLTSDLFKTSYKEIKTKAKNLLKNGNKK